MEIKKISFAFLVTLIFIGTPPLRAQVPPPFETPPVITETEARRFIDEYVNQYMKMDIDAFMAFFSKGAIENRMLTYPDIREIYQGTFENSDSLIYQVEIFSVQINKESAHVTGRYEVTQTLKESPIKKVFRGNIQWNLISENGVLKIREMSYGRDYRGDQPSHPYP